MIIKVTVGYESLSKTLFARVSTISIVSVYEILRESIPTRYTLKVSKIDHSSIIHFTGLVSLTDYLSSFRFTKEVEFEKVIPRYIKIGSFYKKPFDIETSIHEGCVYSFFKNYNPKIIVNVIKALKDLFPNKSIRKSITDCYYCMGEYLMLHNADTGRWELFLRDGDSTVTRSKIIII